MCYDARAMATAQQLADAYDAAILAFATDEAIQRYTTPEGVQVERAPLPDLIAARDRFRAEVAASKGGAHNYFRRGPRR